MVNVLVLVNLVVTVMMTGVIWFVQQVHYPLFTSIGLNEFAAYESAHMSRITLLVGPLMLVELATAGLLMLARPAGVPWWLMAIGFALVLLVWGVTGIYNVAQHSQLARGFDADTHTALVASNWVRTWAWTARTALMVYVVGRAMG